jgi:hypothetical protein
MSASIVESEVPGALTEKKVDNIYTHATSHQLFELCEQGWGWYDDAGEIFQLSTFARRPLVSSWRPRVRQLWQETALLNSAKLPPWPAIPIIYDSMNSRDTSVVDQCRDQLENLVATKRSTR